MASPVVDSRTGIAAPHVVPADQVDAVRERGFVRIPQLLDPATLTGFEGSITRSVLDLNQMHLPLAERDTYNRAFLQVTNLWRHDPVARQLVESPRLAGVAAQLLGVPRVRLYHDQALYKEPGGGITPWHADQYYWPFSSDRCITAWIPLQDTPLELGALEFAAGSHHVEFGRQLPISDESESAIQADLAAHDFQVDRAPYRLGDVSFHLGWTFHRAGPNRSDIPRRVMTVIYVDADMVVAEPANEAQRADLAEYLPGLGPGDVVGSELNPVVSA